MIKTVRKKRIPGRNNKSYVKRYLRKTVSKKRRRTRV